MVVLKFEQNCHQLQQLAASSTYIAYLLKGGDRVRLLGVADSAKGMLTAHSAAITDLAYVGLGSVFLLGMGCRMGCGIEG